MVNKQWILATILALMGASILVACRLQTETIPVEVEEETIEVTRIVVETETVIVEPEAPPVGAKDLIVCMAQEPDTLYPYGGSMLAAVAVQHAIFENNFTNLSFSYQARGVEKVPSLADGDAVINVVEVNAGEVVIDAGNNLAILEEGVEVITAAGEVVVFDGVPIMMEQLVVNYTMKPRVWSDSAPVTAADSVYSYEVAADPDTPISKFTINRTASYEATGELTTRWTGVPGFMDSTYFINFWQPFPRHIWSQYSASELLEAEEVSRLPVGDGPFAIQEWMAGDSIRLTPNEFYYEEGLPYLDSLTYKFIPDTNQLIAQLLAGGCDIGTQDDMDVGRLPFLIEAEANGLLSPHFQAGTVYEHIDFNILPANGRTRWFEDVRVRQAMTMCTNRQSMVDNILYGYSEVIHTYVPSVHPLYPDEVSEWPYDVAAANALLDEADFVDIDGDGWRNHPVTGEIFRVTLGTTSSNERRQQLTQIFRENQIDCGIDVIPFYVPASEWFADGPEGQLFGRRYDLGEFAWLTSVEPPCYLYASNEIPGPAGEPIPGHYNPDQTFTGWGALNNTGWINEEFDAACNRARSALPGTADYEEGHKEAQVIFSQNVPIIPLFLRLKVAAARPEVINFFVDPTQNSELHNIYEIDLRSSNLPPE